MCSWPSRSRWLLLVLLVVGIGCDSAPDGADAAFDQRQPVLSDLAFTPTGTIVFEELPDAQISGDVVELPFTAAVSIQDPDGDLRAVTILVSAASPVGFTEGEIPIYTVGGVTLEATADGRYEAAATLSFPTSAIGRYTVRAQAVDAAGLISNELVGHFNYTSSNAPPVIESVESIPESIDLSNPPSAFIIATASDPDDNIVRVFGNAPNGFEFDLFDDGRTSGDEVAGDGRYTATFSAAPTNPGTQTFTVRAIDRGGLQSEDATLDVIIR